MSKNPRPRQSGSGLTSHAASASEDQMESESVLRILTRI